MNLAIVVSQPFRRLGAIVIPFCDGISFTEVVLA